MSRKVIIPMRPINIVAMRTILANEVRAPVIPIDNPVVPKAEQTSKKISINENESLIQIRSVDRQTIKVATI